MTAYPSIQEHFDAVKALLGAADAAPTDFDAAPTDDCNQFTVSNRFGGIQRLSGDIGTRSVRITIKALGRDAENVRELQRRHDAVRGQRITFADCVSTPIAFESGDAVSPDGDLLVTGAWFSASSTYTYTI